MSRCEDRAYKPMQPTGTGERGWSPQRFRIRALQLVVAAFVLQGTPTWRSPVHSALPGVPEIVDPQTIDCVDPVSRGSYQLRVPCYTTELYRDWFLYPDLDGEDKRAERYRAAFTVAILQPRATSKLQEAGELHEGIRKLARRVLDRMGISPYLERFARTIEAATEEFGIEPGTVGPLLAEMGDVLADSELGSALSRIGSLLDRLDSLTRVSAPAWTELLVHAEMAAAAERRIAVLENWIRSKGGWDPALPKGFSAARDDVRAFLDGDREALLRALRTLKSNLGDRLIDLEDMVLEIAEELGLLEGRFSACFLKTVYPWLLAYRMGREVVNDATTMQELCVGATLDAHLREAAADLYEKFERSLPGERESARKRFLTALEMRYALGHWYVVRYSDLLSLEDRTLDWLLELIASLSGWKKTADEYRNGVLAVYESRNLEGTRTAREYLQLSYNVWPQVSMAGVQPAKGDLSTEFLFSVQYRDPDGSGRPPVSANVVVDGRRYPVGLLEGRPDDGTYAVRLRLSRGTHVFFFEFWDADGGLASSPWYAGPYVQGPPGGGVVRLRIPEGDFGCGSQCLGIEYWLDSGKIQRALGDALCGTGVAVEVPAGAILHVNAWSVAPTVELVEWEEYCGQELVNRCRTTGFRVVDLSVCDDVSFVPKWRASPGAHRVSGRVTEPDGRPVAGAAVRAVPSGRETTTSGDGTFAFAGLVGLSRYEFSVSAPGHQFHPARAVVECLSQDVEDVNFLGVPGDREPPTVAFVRACPTFVEDPAELRFSWAGWDDASPPERLEFRYRILGSSDESWTAWSGVRDCAPDLPNGTYRLEVEARDEARNVCFMAAGWTFAVNARPAVRAIRPSRLGRWTVEVDVGCSEEPCGDLRPIVILTSDLRGVLDPGLVPVRLLDPSGRLLFGAARWLAEGRGAPVSFERARLGWAVRLPEVPEAGRVRTYAVQWGRLVELGWREKVELPWLAEPDGGEEGWWVFGEPGYLDEERRLWRLVGRAGDRIPLAGVTRESRIWLEVWHANGALLRRDLVEASVAQFRQEGGRYVGKTQYYSPIGGSFLRGPEGVQVFWRVFDYEYWGAENKTECRYARAIYDPMTLTRKGPVSYSPPSRGDWYSMPTRLEDGDSLLYTWIDPGGKIIASRMDRDGRVVEHGRVLFEGFSLPDACLVQMHPALAAGDGRLWLFFEARWYVEGKERGEVFSLILGPDGSVSRGARALEPTSAGGSAGHDFGFCQWSPVVDGRGRIWVSHGRDVSGRARTYYYTVLSPDDTVVRGPVDSDWDFRLVDRDGLLWALGQDGVSIVNPESEVVARGPLGGWVPNATGGTACALVERSAFRTFERWSAQALSLPGAPRGRNRMLELMAVDWHGQGLGVRDLQVAAGGAVIATGSGNFTGSLEIDVGQLFGEGPGRLWLTQSGPLGGEIVATFPVEPRKLFRRGDANADGDLNITDPMYVLNFLFLGGPAAPCGRAADADGSGTLNITDPVYLLNYLFLGGPAPAAPYDPEGGCGVDDEGGDLDCESFPPCEE